MFKLYVDGSFMNGKCGAGWVLVDENDNEVARESFLLKSDYGMRQVTGEIYATLFGVLECLNRKIKHVDIYYDYLGVSSWVTGAWKAKNKGTQEYRDLMREANAEIGFKFIKVKSHSGNYFNDLADRLAKEACI